LLAAAIWGGAISSFAPGIGFCQLFLVLLGAATWSSDWGVLVASTISMTWGDCLLGLR